MDMGKKLRRCSAVIMALAIMLAACAAGLFLLWQHTVELKERGDVYESGVYEALEGATIVWEETADELSGELEAMRSGELSYEDFEQILEHRSRIISDTFRIRLAWWNTVTCGQSAAGSSGPAKYGELNRQLMRLVALLTPAPEPFAFFTDSELALLAECYDEISGVLNYRQDSFIELLRSEDPTDSELEFAIELFAPALDEIERLVLPEESE